MAFVSVLQQIRDEWDHLANEDALQHAYPALDGRDEDAFWRSGEELVRSAIEPELAGLPGSEDGSAALDIGCGPGRVLRPLAAHFDEVHGVDVSAEMVRRARACVDDMEGVTVHLGDGMTLQCVRRMAFDLVFSYGTLSQLPDRAFLEYVLRQCKHRLKPDGLCKFQLDVGSFSDNEIARVIDCAGLQLQKSARDDKDLWIWARRP